MRLVRSLDAAPSGSEWRVPPPIVDRRSSGPLRVGLLEERTDDAVALTRDQLEAFSLQYANPPVLAGDESGILQPSHDDRDRRTMDAEHDCEKLLLQLKFVRADTILGLK